MKNVDIVDIRAYFGILYLQAALRDNLLSREEIWGHESANNLSAATLSQNRFKFISWLITFDGKPTRGERWKNNKFAAMRKVFEMFKVRCGRLCFSST